MSECGIYSTYVQGCRCVSCKKANATYQRKYRSAQDKRKIAVKHSKRRNRAAMLALRYLRDNDKTMYYKVMDEARQWVENTDHR
jgi:hypothetical protein